MVNFIAGNPKTKETQIYCGLQKDGLVYQFNKNVLNLVSVKNFTPCALSTEINPEPVHNETFFVQFLNGIPRYCSFSGIINTLITNATQMAIIGSNGPFVNNFIK